VSKKLFFIIRRLKSFSIDGIIDFVSLLTEWSVNLQKKDANASIKIPIIMNVF